MFRILLIEIKKYLKSPITIAYLVFPIFPFVLVTLSLDMPTGLTFSIFVQTLLVSLFIYGNRLKSYKSETMSKKINNSKVKHFHATAALLLTSLIILSISLFIPFIVTIFNVDSLSYFAKNQYSINIDGKNVGEIMTPLKEGLNKNLLLFNSNFSQFLQFVFTLVIVVGSIFSIAHFSSITIKNDSTYFSFSLLLFLTVSILSSLISKDMFIMESGEYVRRVPILGNKFFILLKNINPFYWINQLLMNSTIADIHSGHVEPPSELFPIPPFIEADGTFIPSYYNIFNIGTFIKNDGVFTRTVFLDNIEIFQILPLIIPLIFFVTPVSLSIIKGAN